jgi:hypothetical protein
LALSTSISLYFEIFDAFREREPGKTRDRRAVANALSDRQAADRGDSEAPYRLALAIESAEIYPTL